MLLSSSRMLLLLGHPPGFTCEALIQQLYCLLGGVQVHQQDSQVGLDGVHPWSVPYQAKCLPADTDEIQIQITQTQKASSQNGRHQGSAGQ
jgi:hypothetical protein